MWVFTRRIGERVVVGPGMVVEVTEISGDSVELTFRSESGWSAGGMAPGVSASRSARDVQPQQQALEDTVRSHSREESPYFAECP